MSAGVEEFWYGSAERWSARMVPRVMISYNAVRRLRTPWELTAPVMMDSGAFTVISRHGRYPWEPADYAAAADAWGAGVRWTMDFPCEPSVRAAGRYTPHEAQVLTDDNSRRLFDLGAHPSSVVQGWEISDYLSNLDILKDDGLLTGRLGIGSICRRGRTDEIVRIIRAIKANVPGWVKLHGFGVKTAVLGTEARFLLHSVDSSSWRFPAFNHYRGPRHRPISYKAPILERYVARHEGMLHPVDPLAAAVAEGRR